MTQKVVLKRKRRVIIGRWLLIWIICTVSTWGFAGLVYGLHSDSSTVAHSGEFAELQKLFLTDGAENDQFGSFVAMDGEFAVVSAYARDITSTVDEGAVYVYRRVSVEPEEWELVKELTADDGVGFSWFGLPVAISGDYVAVGTPLTAVDGVTGSPGAVYLFNRNEGGSDNWGQIAKLNADDAVDGDFFGHWLTLDGENLVVGAPYHGDFGAAYVFQKQSSLSDWDQVQKLLPDASLNIGGFGDGMDLTDDILVVGSDDGLGAAYVYQLESGVFSQTQILTVTDSAKGFGESVAIDNGILAIAAPHDVYADDLPGVVYLFEQNGSVPGEWNFVKELQAEDAAGHNTFGFTVSVWQDTIVVGARLEDAAYVFHRDAGGFDNWGQVKKLTASDNEEGETEEFGMATAVTGDTILIGARYTTIDETDGQGAAYIFRHDPGFDLDVLRTGFGTGSVTSQISGVDCGLTCTAAFPIGEIVTLTAVADTHSSFTGWTGACVGMGECIVTMTQTQQVTAAFATTLNEHLYLPVILKE